MITIPTRLLEEDFVTVFHRSASTVMLKKQVAQSLGERHSYVSQHVLTMIVAGEQHIQAYDGETIILRAGDMGAIRRGLYTITDLITENGEFTAFLLFFDDERLYESFSALKVYDNCSSFPFYSFKTPVYLPSFWKSVEELHAHLPHHHALSTIKADEFFAVLTTGETGKLLIDQLSSWTTTIPGNLRQFMEIHYDKSLSIKEYAYLTGRSESTFRREFKARFGIPPRQWIIRKRLEKAHELLESTDWEVAHVAEAVGYDNVSHFISAFRKEYQRTPRQESSPTKVFDRKIVS